MGYKDLPLLKETEGMPKSATIPYYVRTCYMDLPNSRTTYVKACLNISLNTLVPTNVGLHM